MTIFWRVNLSFPFRRETYVYQTEEAERIVGQLLDGAGIGFGFRDIDWSFTTPNEAFAAAQRLIDADFKDVHVARLDSRAWEIEH